jgi:hypothetical protein
MAKKEMKGRRGEERRGEERRGEERRGEERRGEERRGEERRGEESSRDAGEGKGKGTRYLPAVVNFSFAWLTIKGSK